MIQQEFDELAFSEKMKIIWGLNLMSLRIILGYDRINDFAEDLGVHRNVISRIENGHIWRVYKTFGKIYEKFGITPSDVALLNYYFIPVDNYVLASSSESCKLLLEKLKGMDEKHKKELCKIISSYPAIDSLAAAALLKNEYQYFVKRREC